MVNIDYLSNITSHHVWRYKLKQQCTRYHLVRAYLTATPTNKSKHQSLKKHSPPFSLLHAVTRRTAAIRGFRAHRYGVKCRPPCWISSNRIYIATSRSISLRSPEDSEACGIHALKK